MNEIKILIADDHAIVLDGLKAVLSADDSMTVVATALNGQEALEIAADKKPDVVVLDVNMPVLDGISCARALKKNFPKIKIIILTMYPQNSFIEEIVKIGVDGCLLKNNTGTELIDAIHRVMSGRQYYDRLSQFNSDENEVAQFKLSVREIDIIKQLSLGLTSQEIADKLFISEHTVKTHRKNILKKLDLKNSSQLIQFATSNQLI